MVEPLSVTIGIGVAITALLAAYGLYAAGQRPAYMVDMREVSRYYKETAAVSALEDDVGDSEGGE